VDLADGGRGHRGRVEVCEELPEGPAELGLDDAARELEPFEEAYARADWSRFERLPLFGLANRINAYNTYLLMEQEVGR
jgi:hypothetical protein